MGVPQVIPPVQVRSRVRMGVPQVPPISRTGWGTPPLHPRETEQHSEEHLPRGERYASCVHAGGLVSILVICFNLTSLGILFTVYFVFCSYTNYA